MLSGGDTFAPRANSVRHLFPPLPVFPAGDPPDSGGFPLALQTGKQPHYSYRGYWLSHSRPFPASLNRYTSFKMQIGSG